jgi:hypothetical protein
MINYAFLLIAYPSLVYRVCSFPVKVGSLGDTVMCKQKAMKISILGLHGNGYVLKSVV